LLVFDSALLLDEYPGAKPLDFVQYLARITTLISWMNKWFLAVETANLSFCHVPILQEICAGICTINFTGHFGSSSLESGLKLG
jgi:hypothetical protein